jgi:hypothetical protein
VRERGDRLSEGERLHVDRNRSLSGTLRVGCSPRLSLPPFDARHQTTNQHVVSRTERTTKDTQGREER